MKIFLTTAVLSFLVIAAIGCETLQDDLAYIGEELSPPTPSDAAQWMFDEYDAEKRRKGITLLANSPFGGSEPYVRAYRLRVEEDENPIVKAAAIRALARHGSPEDAPLIAAQLQHESQQVRWEAAKGLQRIHHPDVVPAMLDSMRRPAEDPDVRIALASALAQYPEDRVFQVLVSPAALDAAELALNLTAQESLSTLTGKDFGLDPAAWLAWYNSTEEPFAEQQPYYYPTYQRDDTLLEIIAFWSKNHWETPQQPAGLRPEGTRRTYEEGTDESASEAEG